MRTRASNIYLLVKSIIDASPVKITLGITQVLIGSQRFQPGNDNDNRTVSDYVPAVIITDAPGNDNLGPFSQQSAEINTKLRVYYLRLIKKGDNPIVDCSDEVGELMDIFAGYEYNLNNIEGLKIYTMLPGPDVKPYDSDFTAMWRESGIPLMVGWFDLAVHGVASRAPLAGPGIPLAAALKWRFYKNSSNEYELQYCSSGVWSYRQKWTGGTNWKLVSLAGGLQLQYYLTGAWYEAQTWDNGTQWQFYLKSNDDLQLQYLESGTWKEAQTWTKEL